MGSTRKKFVFIDAFSGCGGLSLGLLQAGLTGSFAIEKDDFAFATLNINLLGTKGPFNFEWPSWLPKAPISIEALIHNFADELRALRGTVDVLAGGPPCQGFSTAGRRRIDDPRNRLFSSYVELVKLIEPKIVLMENVRGFTMSFGEDEEVDNYALKLRSLLSQQYSVYERLVDLSRFGVPQQRTRYFLVALHPEFGNINPFEVIEERLPGFLRRMNLQTPVSSWSAISDLEAELGGTRPSGETSGFLEICPGSRRTSFQKMIGVGSVDINDLRLARHAPEIRQRFAEIIDICQAEGRLNTTISTETRNKYGLKKQALRVLDPDRPAPTITSMPDDLIHYSEPRTLTVRENARLQSFPDWFAFQGKYTTGGDLRRKEVPRFTQVANAVPPLAAQAIGEAIVEILSSIPMSPAPPQTSLIRARKRNVKQAELLTKV